MATARQRIPQKNELLSLLFAVVVVLLVGVLSYRTWIAYNRLSDQLQISQRFIGETDALLSSLKDAETGQRGFLLTGEDAYLEPYRQALARLPVTMGNLAAIAQAQRPDQAPRIERLKLPIKNKLDELQQTIGLRQSRGLNAALVVVLTDRGKADMDQIRSICAEIQSAANERVARFSEQSRASIYELGVISTAGSTMLLVLLLLSAFTIQRATQRRQRLIEKLQNSEERVTEARDWLQTTLASIGDAVIATDSEGRINFLNLVAQSLTGWTQQEAAGKPLEEIFVIRNEKTGVPVENPVAKVLREGRIVGLANHTVLATKDGRVVPIEDSAAPIKDGSQRVLGTVLVFRDVTERRNAEDAVTRNEERLKLALDAGQIGVWDWDVVQNRIEWSELVYDIHGVERGNFRGGVEDFAKLVHPQDRERVNQAISAALRDGAPYNAEFRVIHPDGSVVWVSTTAMVFRSEQGAPTRMLGATTDVTARKRAEDDLRQQWHTFDTALSNTPDFTYVFNLEGRFTYVNRALLSLWQRSLEDSVGKNFFELGYPPELAERLQRQIRQVIETKEPVRDQTPFTGPTGETRHYDYIFVPIFAAGGRVEAVAGSTRDVTDQKRGEEDLKHSNEELKRVNRELEEFAYVASHDLQEPLRMVNIYTQLILKDLGADKAKLAEYGNVVQRGVTRMEMLIRDLLTFSRAVHSDELHVGIVDLSAALQDALSVLKNRIEESGCVVITEPLPNTRGDGPQMSHVFQNLLSNALKYCKTGVPPEIHISARREGDDWIVAVRDNGIGFDPQYAERIFGLFKRLHKEEYPGTGLGLAICKRILERFGGRIWAEGRPGAGATFYFALPAAEGNEVAR